MDKNMDFVAEKRLEQVAKALENNNMQAFVLQKKEEVLPLVKSLIQEGMKVANGGSMSLEQTGVISHLKEGRYQYLDRLAPGVDKEQMQREAFFADVYLASANAITQEGEIYEMDGNANRVAAIAYGPQSVILVVGRNKLVADIQAAAKRNKELSGPVNAKRVGVQTPCTVTGFCADCRSSQRVCCTEVILHYQRIKNRIKVILVNEDLGY